MLSGDISQLTPLYSVGPTKTSMLEKGEVGERESNGGEQGIPRSWAKSPQAALLVQRFHTLSRGNSLYLLCLGLAMGCQML